MDFRKARAKLGMTQKQMARALNTDHDYTISRWETGNRQPNGQAERLLQLLLDLQEKKLIDWYMERYADGKNV